MKERGEGERERGERVERERARTRKSRYGNLKSVLLEVLPEIFKGELEVSREVGGHWMSQRGVARNFELTTNISILVYV